MDYKTANIYRTFFTKMFQTNREQYYFCAIVQDLPIAQPDDYSLVFYGRNQYSSFLVELSTLLGAIENIVTTFRVSYCEYDAGTTEMDLRVAVKLSSIVPA